MKTIYISGPITDNLTGLPREGWKRDFQQAEEKLREMGFEVINPIDIANFSDKLWELDKEEAKLLYESKDIKDMPQKTPRWYYLCRCIDFLSVYCRASYTNAKIASPSGIILEGKFTGLYVIGHPDDIQQSFGTMTEINFALSANLPVWSQYYHGYQIDNLLRQITTKPTLAEIQRTIS